MSRLHHCTNRIIAAAISILFAIGSAPVHAISITVTGVLGDLDGNGDGGSQEAAVVTAAKNIWESFPSILPGRSTTISVVAKPLGGPLGLGGIDTFDVDIPNSGSTEYETGTLWFVDPSPGDDDEFDMDGDLDALHGHYINGPTGYDLLSAVVHEFGHALGWHATSDKNFNPRYTDLMSPDHDIFENGTRVHLVGGLAPPFAGVQVPLRGDGLNLVGGIGSGGIVNELSHTGDTGADLNWKRTAMTGVLPFSERYLPGLADIKMFEVAYSASIAAVPIPGAIWLFGSGLLGLIGIARKRKAG